MARPVSAGAAESTRAGLDSTASAAAGRLDDTASAAAEPLDGAAQPEPPAASPVRPAPPRVGLLDLRLPAFWLVAGLVLVGGWRIGVMIHRALTEYPLPALAALVLFALYAVPFVLVVRSLDYPEQEPPLLLAIAFAWGGVVATSHAIPANAAVRDIVAKLVSPTFADSWSPAISAPLVEETLKTLGVIAVVLLAQAHVNSTMDGFVYGAFVGLGFQVVENFVYAVNAVIDAERSGLSDWLSPVIATFVARGFLGGLWSHTMFSALAGAGIGYAVTRVKLARWRRVGVAGLAFIGAWGFHFVWNSPLLADGFGLHVGGVLAALVLKGLPGLVLVLLLVRAAMRHEAAYYSDLLRLVRDPSLVTQPEAEAMFSGRTRLAARRHARSQSGLRAGFAVRRLQRAQARFVVELSRSLDGRSTAETESHDSPLGHPTEQGAERAGALVKRRRELLKARQRLRELGIEQVEAPDPPRHSAVGLLTIGLGLVGVVAPLGSVLAIGIAAERLLAARRRRTVADNWLVDGLIIGCIGPLLWLLSLAISRAGLGWAIPGWSGFGW